MSVIDKVFPKKEKKTFFKTVAIILLVVFLLLLPALLKLAFPRTHASPNWGRFIFAHVLFLAQASFFFLHPACRKVSKIGQYAIGFLLLYLFLCLLSPWLTDSRSFQELIKVFSASSLLFLFLYYSYKAPNFPILRFCAYFGCILATAEALIGLGQYICQGDLGLQWIGEKCLDLSGSNATVRLGEKMRWTWDTFSSNSLETLRSYGTFDHPNHLGGFLAAGFLLTCHLILYDANKRTLQILLAIALLLQTMALTTTFSRSAWLGAVFGFIILMGLRLAQPRASSGIERTLLGAIGLSVCIMVFCFHGQIFDRCFPHYKNCQTIEQPLQLLTEHDIGDRGRFQTIAGKMILHHPWKGVGFREFVRQTPKFANSSLGDHLPVHNIYLLVAAELGFPAAAAFVIFFILVAWQAFRHTKIEVLAALWVLCSLIGFMDNYFLTSQAGRLFLFVVAALILIRYSPQEKTRDI